ncbi:MAG: hypothetical protein K0R57_1727 [Paenibacillaceae bacterium]|jgi:hypothetical protein|nr:hypothetical protein [Paenibacillaceae bacterium]
MVMELYCTVRQMGEAPFMHEKNCRSLREGQFHEFVEPYIICRRARLQP